MPEFSRIDRVKVDRDGTVFLNGQIVSLEALKQEFALLKQANGAVWYHREDPQGDAPRPPCQ